MAKAAADLTGPWIYDQLGGQIRHVNWAQWFAFYSLRVNGLWLPFDSKTEAEAYKRKHPPRKGTGGAVGGAIEKGLNPGAAGSEAIEKFKEAGGVLTDISGLATALTQRNTWMRIGQGALGMLLIGIGVMAVTRSTPIGSAVKSTAGTAAKVLPAGKAAKAIKKVT